MEVASYYGRGPIRNLIMEYEVVNSNKETMVRNQHKSWTARRHKTLSARLNKKMAEDIHDHLPGGKKYSPENKEISEKFLPPEEREKLEQARAEIMEEKLLKTKARKRPLVKKQYKDPEIYLRVESFTWKENGILGERPVKESGPRFGLGFTDYRVLRNGLSLRPCFELFGGSVDYDGATLQGEPFISETYYFGLKGRLDVGYPMGGAKAFEPFMGIGARYWTRDIQDSTTALGAPALGHREEWLTLYGRIGIRLMTRFERGSVVRFEIGAQRSLSNNNVYHFSDNTNESDRSFDPGNKTSFFTEAGFHNGRYSMSLFYETLRFKETIPEHDSNLGLYLYQPRVEMVTYGIKVGKML
jgi:hypothetical protein